MRVFREPCYFAEAVYLLYYFVNEVSYAGVVARICKCYCRKADEEEEGMMRRIQELTRVSRVVTADLDRESPKLRHYFEKLPGLEKRPDCCLAQVMLVSIPLDCSDVDAFAAQLLEAYTCMFQEGIKINDLNGMGLVVERQDAQEETESLMVQLERLPCSIEGRWTILRALTEFETHLKELTELIRGIRDRYHLTVLLIEHHMDVVMDISDRIYVLNYGGLIAEGMPTEIQQNDHLPLYRDQCAA